MLPSSTKRSASQGPCSPRWTGTLAVALLSRYRYDTIRPNDITGTGIPYHRYWHLPCTVDTIILILTKVNGDTGDGAALSYRYIW